MKAMRGMRIPITVAGAALVIVLAWLWFPLTDARRVRYHLDRIHWLQGWPKAPVRFTDYFRYRTWLWYLRGRPSIPQVFERIEQHRQALVRLGYFETREFALRRRTRPDAQGTRDFNAMLTNAAFSDMSWTWTAPSVTSSVIRVTARREDMPMWERIVSQFDSTDPQ